MGRRLVVGAVIVSLVAATGGVGCGASGRHSHGGRLVTEYPMRNKPQFGWTRVPAVYVLYAQKDPPEGYPGAKKASRMGWQLTEVRLAKRSPLGFKMLNGSLVAVAGDDQIPLPPGEYCWHTRPNSEPINWGATAGAVLLIGVVAAGIAAVVISESESGLSGSLLSY